MSLLATLSRLIDELDVHLDIFQEFVAGHSTVAVSSAITLSDECVLEGQVSRVWQAWSLFWRECLFQSCLGTTNGNGVPIVAHPDAINRERISSACIRVKQAKRPYWKGLNTVLRAEPTWGDTDVLASLVGRLSPSNHAQLLAAISSGHTSAKRLQAIRNGAAHISGQTLADVTAFQTSYISFSISHPTHALFWVEPVSKDYLFTHMVEDLKESAFAAIS